MKQGILKLELVENIGLSASYRTIFKTQHGRVIFLSLQVTGGDCTITDCFYVDRRQYRYGLVEYGIKPLKLQTFKFSVDTLLSIVETELDRKFYGIEFMGNDTSDLSFNEYLQDWISGGIRKHKFLIMVGEGAAVSSSLPSVLKTRLKNRIHRAIYLELAYYKDDTGLVRKCHYYDRHYRRTDIKVTPSSLVSCFFKYDKENIMRVINNELCCDFNHMIITGDDGINIDLNEIPLCGSI